MSNRIYSSPVNLSVVAAALCVPLLTGCDNDATAYKDPGACVSEGHFSESFCNNSYAEVQQLHWQMDPVYDRDVDCRADWDPCDAVQTITQPTSGGGSHVVVVSNTYSGETTTRYQPRLQGMVIGRTKAVEGANPVPAQRFAEPILKASDGTFRAMATHAEFESFGRLYSYTHVPEARPYALASRPVVSSGTTIVRGGFSGVPAMTFGG